MRVCVQKSEREEEKEVKREAYKMQKQFVEVALLILAHLTLQCL